MKINYKNFYYLRLLLIFANDFFILNFSLYLSYFFRLDYFVNLSQTFIVFAYANIIYFFLFFYLKIYNQYFRFFDITAYKFYIKKFLLFSILLSLLIVNRDFYFFPRSLVFIFPITFASILIFNRVLVSNIFGFFDKSNQEISIIFGFDKNHCQFLSNYTNIILFVDNNRINLKREFNGIKIISTHEFNKEFKKYNFNKIYIFNEKTFNSSKNIIRNYILDNDILVQKIDNENKNIKFSTYFDFNYYFNRKAKTINSSKSYNKKIILITGAGGSIGFGIVSQLINYNFKKLILIDNSEYNLYSIINKLSKLKKTNNISFHLQDFDNNFFISKVLSQYSVDIIFHAAAYKHVPLIEINPFSAIKNNFLNTHNFIKLCKRKKVPYFCLISSDKAVRPTNYMGASKRLSELSAIYLNKFQNKHTKVCCVRFGNVINSSGSVLPLFSKQIDKGGPLTLTDKKIIRYFMTIEEAANLVISVYQIAKGGEIFLLDMGEPIKLYDLAKMMIQFSGKRQGSNGSGNIKIKYIGLRKGEKLFEELLVNNNSEKTSLKNIFQSIEKTMDMRNFQKIFKEIQNSYNKNDIKKLNSILGEKHIGYKNTNQET